MFAQNSSSIQLGEKRSKEKGELLVLTFREGLPAPGVSLFGPFGEKLTDNSGMFSTSLEEGEYELTLPRVGEKFKFKIVSKEETLVSINLVEGETKFEMDLPEGVDSNLIDIKNVQGLPVSFSVYEGEGKKPIEKAIFRVAGFGGQLSSNPEGKISLNLPEGEHTLVIVHPNFLMQTKKIEVAPNSREFNFILRPTGSELEEIVVLTPQLKGALSALVEMRRQSSAVTEVLGAEQMGRQGDSDAGGALRRVTGLTLMGGKYVYVRGLGERYSSVQMNDLALPSPEPARRVVPLDLFPISVLESITVQKSASANLPGELGGGLIQLKSKSVPERFFVKGSISTQVGGAGNQQTYVGGKTDWAGVDDGTRSMPSNIREALLSGKKLNENQPPGFTKGFSAQDLQTLGRSLKNIYNISSGGAFVPPGASLSGGNSWKFQNLEVGTSGSLSLNTNGDTGEKNIQKFNIGTGDKLVLDEKGVTGITETERNVGGTLNLGLKVGNSHEIVLGKMLLRNSTDSVYVKEYSLMGDSVEKRKKTTLEWVERQLDFNQLNGKHKFSFFDWSYRVGISSSRRESPDSRNYTYLKRSSVYELNMDATGNQRNYGDLKDKTRQFGTDFTFPLPYNVKLSAGLDNLVRGRKSEVYRLHFRNNFPTGKLPDLTKDPETIFKPANINTDGFVLTNLTESADSYSSDQDIFSFFGQAEYNFLSNWTLLAGLRREKFHQEVKTFYYFDPGKPTSLAGLRNTDILPSYSLTWKPNEALRGRLAFSETLSRPDARELSTVPFIDDESGFETVGNSDLKTTLIKNFDHRWEYYFNAEEFLSSGVFLKQFINPVEEIFEPGPNLRKTYANASSATNMGVEFEGRYGLRRLDRFLRRFTLISNLSLIKSQVEIPEDVKGILTTSKRPLQGQSPYVFNFQVQYDYSPWGLQSTLLYNIIGERITEVGTNKRPDIYEMPFHQLDLVSSVKLSGYGIVNLKLKNLLDLEAKSTQGNEIVKREKKGRSLSVGYTMQY